MRIRTVITTLAVGHGHASYYAWRHYHCYVRYYAFIYHIIGLGMPVGCLAVSINWYIIMLPEDGMFGAPTRRRIDDDHLFVTLSLIYATHIRYVMGRSR